MGYPVVLNGRTYTLADFEGLNYVAGFPDALESFVTDAGTKVTAAQAAQTAAEVAQAAAEAALDTFDDRFLGTKSTEPTLDNDGNALTDGALFFDTTVNVIKVYDLGNDVWKQVAPTTGQQANIDTVAGISADISTVASNNANVTTVATNIVDVNSFAEVYRIAATEPTTSLDEGDLYYDTTDNKVQVYNGSAWQDVAPVATSITASQISDVTSTAAELNLLDGVTATTAELNLLDGVTATTAEINHLDGVTSNIQTQINNIPPGGLILISEVNASASSSVELGGMNSTYKSYLIIASNLVMSTSSNIKLTVKQGGSFLTTGYYGNRAGRFSGSTSQSNAQIENAANFLFVNNNPPLNNFVMKIFDPAAASQQTNWIIQHSGNEASTSYSTDSNGMQSTAGATTDVKFQPDSGTFTSGSFKLYGFGG